MATDIIGTDRRRRSLRGMLRRHRRPAAALAALAVLALAAGAVTVGRSGLDRAPAASAARPVPTGTVVDLAADGTTLVALVDACAGGPETCGLRLVVSRDTGRSWQERTVPVPGLRGADVGRWRPLVHGDVVTIEDAERELLHHSGDGGRTWVTRPVADGAPGRSVPAGFEDRVVLRRGVLSWVDPASGVRRALAARLPVAPRAVRAEPGVLWVAGLDPRGRYAAAATRDGGVTWATTVLPGAGVEAGLILEVAPLPGGDAAWFVSGYVVPGRGLAVVDAWFLPPYGGAPLQVSPEQPLVLGVGLGLANGLLLVGADRSLSTLSPGGTIAGPGEQAPARDPVRGPRGDLVAVGVGTPRPGIAVSATGAPGDWELRPVTW